VDAQADAFVCMDLALARAIGNTVTATSIDDLLGSAQPRMNVVFRGNWTPPGHEQ
jgi:hypothetical protein